MTKKMQAELEWLCHELDGINIGRTAEAIGELRNVLRSLIAEVSLLKDKFNDQSPS